MLPALQFALGQRSRIELPRQLVILTDGEVTNTDAVLELATQHAGEARIFTFGIGAGASHHLVRGLARAGGGTAEFIYPGERIEPEGPAPARTPALARVDRRRDRMARRRSHPGAGRESRPCSQAAGSWSTGS